MASLVTQGSATGTGSVTLTTPNTNSNQTLTLPDASATLVGDTTPQTLTNKTIQGGALTLGTAQNTTSGTAIDFTGIPAWVKRITVMFSGVSTNGSSPPLIQLGAGSVTTTGYSSAFGDINGANTCGLTFSTAGIVFAGRYLAGASSAVYGSLILTTLGSNIWACSGAVANVNVSYQGGGGVTLPGTLDRVRLTTTNGTDTFDAGSVNIIYEG
jgi:hypothetical protein